MEHISGPWEVDEHDKLKIIVSQRSFGGIIATSSAWWYDTESAKANARLIAAAPDLLNASKMSLGFLEIFKDTLLLTGDKEENEIRSYANTLLNNLQSAIAKAEGN